MTVIVDASVAIKWVMVEDGSDAANSLVTAENLAAPELLFAECANVLWTKVRRGHLSPQLAKHALTVIDSIPIRAVPIRQHFAAALAIALELDRSAYDSLYLAVALAERATLITADVKFAAAAQAHPTFGSSVRLLTP
ncbi:MAG TPA: type II toxin-antitoxin system VapC family toxin [Caulobacteraceae bacterium]|jgi:predicted nucleic acid-binding protein|nr:type II toxin-antitoxin system VapC family toxin [Caulobacteraceae bacterium]